MLKRIQNKIEYVSRQKAIQYECATTYYGSQFAGWTVCKDKVQPNAIVYSFGVGNDISFDLEIIADLDVTIHAFDPTPKVITWIETQTLPSRFHFHDFGIASYTGKTTFYSPEDDNHISHSMFAESHIDTSHSIDVPVYTFDNILKKLNHQHIDVLKLDIEGAEYDVLDNINFEDYNIQQVLVEFHHRWDSFSRKQTNNAIRRLQSFGYQIFSVSKNHEEIGFIKS